MYPAQHSGKPVPHDIAQIHSAKTSLPSQKQTGFPSSLQDGAEHFVPSQDAVNGSQHVGGSLGSKVALPIQSGEQVPEELLDDEEDPEEELLEELDDGQVSVLFMHALRSNLSNLLEDNK